MTPVGIDSQPRHGEITQKCFEQKWVNYPKVLKAEMGKIGNKG
jgi:hypothetical protein